MNRIVTGATALLFVLVQHLSVYGNLLIDAGEEVRLVAKAALISRNDVR